MKIVFSAQAKAGLREIALFIARDNKARALSFVRELREKAQQVGDMPRAFPLVPRYEHHGIRRRRFGNYLIFYRIEDNRVSIVHIMHGARDYEALLFPQE
jgi:toxin ParE1/3/4